MTPCCGTSLGLARAWPMRLPTPRFARAGTPPVRSGRESARLLPMECFAPGTPRAKPIPSSPRASPWRFSRPGFSATRLISAQDSLASRFGSRRDRPRLFGKLARAFRRPHPRGSGLRSYADAPAERGPCRHSAEALSGGPYFLRGAQRQDQAGSDRDPASRLGVQAAKLVAMEPGDGGERDSKHNGVDHVLMQNEKLRHRRPDADGQEHHGAEAGRHRP